MKARKATPLARIELLILDVDGVLTDGRLYFAARGEALKVFHVRDGHGIKLLMSAGVAVAAFSGRRSAAVAIRMRELGVRRLVQACSDKVAALRRLTAQLGIDPLHCACICDDTPDLGWMALVCQEQRRSGRRARILRRRAARPRRGAAAPPGTALMLFRVFTLLAVLALCISTWFVSSPARRRQTPIDTKLADLPGYYLKNAVLTDYDIAGDPSIRIEAERIDQIAHSNEVALYNIRVAYQSPNGQNWVMVGDVAHVQPGGKVVDVTGNVRLQGDAGGRGAAPVIHTDTLSYNIPDAVASTKSDVRIDFAQHTLTARGLSANLKERTMRLESKVNGRFHP